jgi:predicted transcriptional regulator
MKKNIANEKKVTEKMIAAITSNETTSKSEKMKNLFDIGMNVKEISVVMDVRYNFVYNVVSNYVNMNKIELVAEEKNVKKDLIIAMFLKGKSNKEISIELSTNYNYVHNVLKQYKLQNVPAVQTESDEQKAE